MEMHHLLRRHPQSHPTVTSTSSDFDSIFAGVSLQSLLLGDPVLLTPPPPPFPPSPSPDSLPHHRHHHHLDFLPPPAFSFRAAQPAPSTDKRPPHPRRNQAAPPPPRHRAQKVSEKLKALRRIVPCDPKADIATMLEQAYKYVRYLEAQVLALLTMQLCTLNERGLCSDIGVGGTSEIERRMIESVGRLSRKEVLEAVVNSGTAQKVMYEEGLCLLSEEQVRVLAWSAFQKQQQQQQLLGLIGGAANVGNNNNNSADTNMNSSSSTTTSSCCYSYSSCSYSYS